MTYVQFYFSQVFRVSILPQQFPPAAQAWDKIRGGLCVGDFSQEKENRPEASWSIDNTVARIIDLFQCVEERSKKKKKSWDV
jgi:hypothetical protein